MMTAFRAFLIVTIIGGASDLLAADATPTWFSCPTTTPTASRPDALIDPFDADQTLYYENGLWVAIPQSGIIVLSPTDEITFGPLTSWRSETITWLRIEGVEGFVEVTGRRLDMPSDLTPQTPLSPQRQYVRVGSVSTGLAFPSEGCWEVTGSVADHEITFVVDVRFVNELVATPTS